MRSLTCIVCPVGCALQAEVDPSGDVSVAGNRCPRGAAYAAEEIRAPKRTVTATCRLGPAAACSESASAGRLRRRGLCDPRRLPVRTSAPCPRELVDDLLADIYAATAVPPVRRGDVVIGDWRGTGIDVVAARALD